MRYGIWFFLFFCFFGSFNIVMAPYMIPNLGIALAVFNYAFAALWGGFVIFRYVREEWMVAP